MKPLNIVCISYHAPPLNEVESLCTGRLLSALVQLGARVHLISHDVPATLPIDINEEIFDERLCATRVPAEQNGNRFEYMFRYGTHDLHARWIGPAVSAARKILRQYENPILLTRTFPLVSSYAGFYCRDLAKAWVAHFSDPFPIDQWLLPHWYSRFAMPLNKRWAIRILDKADLVTVTCSNAIRYMEEKNGYSFRSKAMVVTHLAMPQLKRGSFTLQRSRDEFVVAHVGALLAARRPDLLLQGAILAMEKHPAIRFLQYGGVEPRVLEMCRKSKAFRRLDIRCASADSPRDATDLREQVDVNVIVDVDLGLPYSPFIPSKFSHSVCSGKPLLIISTEDSQMAEYTRRYGGGIFVPYSTPEKVCEAICKLYELWREERELKIASEYMNEFTPENVVYPFMERLRRLPER
jgi:glycosyltransferase involved in cell wall biosynthesis